MSSPAPTPSDERAERRKSLGKYVKRLSTALRRGSSSKSTPTITATQAPAVVSLDKTATNEPAAEPAKSGPVVSPGLYIRSAIQQERARALFAKYGLTLETHEWLAAAAAAATNVERVEKPIRLRVRRTCHRCQAVFGADKICSGCEHKRCKKCPRYPVKKVATDQALSKGKAPIYPQPATESRSRVPKLTIKSKTGTELVYQPIKQRIRRTCHKCNAFFQPATATVCAECQHIRCTKCPRDPAKKKKWPNGYPGDVPAEESEPEKTRPQREFRKPRQRIRWTCEECSTLFKEKEPTCASCGHERCKTCTRVPPKKMKKEFDPELVKAVEEKLARLSVREPANEPSAS